MRGKVEEPSYRGQVKMGDEELKDAEIPVGHCGICFLSLERFMRSGEEREIRKRRGWRDFGSDLFQVSLRQ